MNVAGPSTESRERFVSILCINLRLALSLGDGKRNPLPNPGVDSTQTVPRPAHSGLALDAALAELPLVSPDPALRQILKRQAQSVLSSLAPAHVFVA